MVTSKKIRTFESASLLLLQTDIINVHFTNATKRQEPDTLVAVGLEPATFRSVAQDLNHQAITASTTQTECRITVELIKHQTLKRRSRKMKMSEGNVMCVHVGGREGQLKDLKETETLSERHNYPEFPVGSHIVFPSPADGLLSKQWKKRPEGIWSLKKSKKHETAGHAERRNDVPSYRHGRHIHFIIHRQGDRSN